MASPGLALSRSTNLDQEFAPEYQSPLTGSAPGNSASGSDVQPLPIGTPHDTVTLSNSGSQHELHQALVTSSASSAFSAAAYPTIRAKASISAVSAIPKASPKPESAPREAEVPKEDLYQATTQNTQQSLLQLDRTLQQIGVDPQHTSLVRRVALVRLANDPPALGEYFGPPSAASAAASNSAAETNSPAPEHTTFKSTADVAKTSSDAPRRPFLPQGKLLNVTA
jgi:hypothetical protein